MRRLKTPIAQCRGRRLAGDEEVPFSRQALSIPRRRTQFHRADQKNREGACQHLLLRRPSGTDVMLSQRSRSCLPALESLNRVAIFNGQRNRRRKCRRFGSCAQIVKFQEAAKAAFVATMCSTTDSIRRFGDRIRDESSPLNIRGLYWCTVVTFYNGVEFSYEYGRICVSAVKCRS
jgi:hypothetical protein